jgi:hypothetical protein
LTELCDSVRQSGITEDPVSSSERQTESIYRGLFVAIPQILLSRQSANFVGFRSASSQLQSFSSYARRFPPERRKTHRTKIHDGWETISATIIPFESLSSAIASAARRHCLYHRFKAFRPCLSALVLKRLYPLARSRAATLSSASRRFQSYAGVYCHGRQNSA